MEDDINWDDWLCNNNDDATNRESPIHTALSAYNPIGPTNITPDANEDGMGVTSSIHTTSASSNCIKHTDATTDWMCDIDFSNSVNFPNDIEIPTDMNFPTNMGFPNNMSFSNNTGFSNNIYFSDNTTPLFGETSTSLGICAGVMPEPNINHLHVAESTTLQEQTREFQATVSSAISHSRALAPRVHDLELTLVSAGTLTPTSRNWLGCRPRASEKNPKETARYNPIRRAASRSKPTSASSGIPPEFCFSFALEVGPANRERQVKRAQRVCLGCRVNKEKVRHVLHM